MPWIIYKHTNKINGKVYIGQTSQTASSRWKNGNGYNQYKRKDYSIFWNAICKYGGISKWNVNWNHEILESNLKSQKEANLKETKWIKKYRSYVGFKNCNGYNMTLGGDNRENLGEPVIQIDKNSKTKIKEFKSSAEASRILCGSEKNASAIRHCCDGSKLSLLGYYWCYKRNFNNSWMPRTSTQLSPVFQIDDKLDVIRRYKSITEAKKDGFSVGTITQCCMRRCAKANGYYWCYEKDYTPNWNPPKTQFIKNEKIYCFETNKTYRNSKEASNKTGANRNHILHCCNKVKKYNSANGLHFCFEKDKEDYKIQVDRDLTSVVCVNTGKKYLSIAAASRETGASQTGIYGCCVGTYKTSNGLTWCYEKNYNSKIKINRGKTRKIICIETNTKYDSVTEASKITGLSRTNITTNLCKKSKTAGGYHWEYCD